jgi:anti-anti-sigma regulatory factor
VVLFFVITECPIFIGTFDGFSWIRCEGKGSFLNSPALKEYGESRIAEGERCLVVDLEACTGMDSTFMGTLAGMASRLSAQGEGVLHIAEAGPRNQRSLEDLGLDFLMQINPNDAPWREKLQSIRAEIKPTQPATASNQAQRARHVLDAHKTLAATNDQNAETFANVVKLLESSLDQKQRPTSDSEPH